MNTFAIGSLPVHFSVAKLFNFRWQYTDVHIGESVFALSYYKNVAVFYPEDNDTITPPVIGIYTSLCCSHSVVHISSGVKYRSFILEWLPHLCNDKRTWLHTFAVILNYEYLEAG